MLSAKRYYMLELSQNQKLLIKLEVFFKKALIENFQPSEPDHHRFP